MNVGLGQQNKDSVAGKMKNFKIDYYSFTVPVRLAYQEVTNEITELVQRTFTSLFKNWDTGADMENRWTLEKAKGFYSHRLRDEKTGAALSFGHTNAHVFIELSGKACSFFTDEGTLDDLIGSTSAKCSRIDFAVDFLTDVEPDDFSAFRNTTRWKHISTINSASGQTCYIGSRTGERMARVYRYRSPHERAHLLRVEVEYKGDAAKAICERYKEVGIEQTTLDANNPFGWIHPLWSDAGGSSVKIPYAAHNPSNAATVRWLYGVVIASIRNAITTNLIDKDAFLKTLLDGLETE